MSDEPSKKGQSTAFAVTWLAYATYYLGRKGFSVSKARISKELGIGETTLASIDTGYLTAYAVGQFVSGVVGDRVGARRLVAGGMLAAAATCAAFGAGNSAAVLLIAFTVNGLAQSTGWPGTTKGMAEWTPPETRGATMGLWCTCYQVGGIIATWFCTWLLGHYGYRSAFFVPAVCIAAVGLIVAFALRKGPYSSATAPGSPASMLGHGFSLALRNGTLWSYGIAYFFIKLIRYSLLFWLRRDRRHFDWTHFGPPDQVESVGGGRGGPAWLGRRAAPLRIRRPVVAGAAVRHHGSHWRAALRSRLARFRRGGPGCGWTGGRRDGYRFRQWRGIGGSVVSGLCDGWNSQGFRLVGRLLRVRCVGPALRRGTGAHVSAKTCSPDE